MSSVTINGRFLTQSLSGVQRYATEIVKALDQDIADTPSAAPCEWRIFAPQTAPELPGLKSIEFRRIGRTGGHLWEQAELAAATDGVLCNLANSAPIAHGKNLVVVHDAAVYRTPRNFSFAYRTLHQTLGRALAHRAKLGTVSEFSRREISDVLRIEGDRIFVAPNGSDHLGKTAPDNAILGKLGLVGRPFFLFVGSPALNKDLPTAIAAFSQRQDRSMAFVVVGASSQAVFRNADNQVADGVVFPGRLSDEEIVALYRECSALIFPSVYEGFGIPPLEATINGASVISADIPPVRETCANALNYFPPGDVNQLRRLMDQFSGPRRPQIQSSQAATIAQRFSWRRSAQIIRKEIEALL